MRMIATLVLLASFTSRPVAAQDFSPDELMAGSARVYEIEYNVATANVNQSDLCVHRRWLSGLVFNRPSPAKPAEPIVYRVWPGSAAEQYGLRADDRITHINGVHLGYGTMGDDNYRRLARDGATVTVVRGNETFAAVMRKQLACGVPVQFLDSAEWVAATNGNNVFVSAGAAAAMTDDELAAVIGHEYAHVALRHIEKKQNRALLGALIGAAVGGAVQAETGAIVAGDLRSSGPRLARSHTPRRWNAGRTAGASTTLHGRGTTCLPRPRCGSGSPGRRGTISSAAERIRHRLSARSEPGWLQMM